jgi:hypothetical protein
MSTGQETSEVIKQTLSEIPAAEFASYGRKKRTKAIRECIREAGEARGYTVYAIGHGPSENEKGEWLFDIIWLVFDRKKYITEDVVLVLECEWNTSPREIDDDFQKLILARADLRCMVFRASSEREAYAEIERLTNQVTQFRKSMEGDNYLFCAWLEDEADFLCYFWQYHLSINILKNAGPVKVH